MTNEEKAKEIVEEVANRLGKTIGVTDREICYQVAMTMAQQKDEEFNQELIELYDIVATCDRGAYASVNKLLEKYGGVDIS